MRRQPTLFRRATFGAKLHGFHHRRILRHDAPAQNPRTGIGKRMVSRSQVTDFKTRQTVGNPHVLRLERRPMQRAPFQSRVTRRKRGNFGFGRLSEGYRAARDGKQKGRKKNLFSHPHQTKPSRRQLRGCEKAAPLWARLPKGPPENQRLSGARTLFRCIATETFRRVHREKERRNQRRHRQS